MVADIGSDADRLRHSACAMTDPGGILARAIDAVRINRCWQEQRTDGKIVWIKRRRIGIDVMVLAGNAFLAVSNSRIRMFPSV